jgi:hypothetical protein
MTQLHPITGRSTTMFRKHFITTVVAAVAILAFSASAAQAHPIGLGYNGQAQTQSYTKGYAGTYRPTQVGAKIMSASVDPANAQQVPVVVTSVQPVASTDSGFNWTAALVGAGIASVVLLLAGATASRIRPRRVAQL